MTKKKKIWSMLEIQQSNHANGQYFFESAALRFFKSRVSDVVYQGKGGIYFVTSEKHDNAFVCEPRLYTVRRFVPKGGRVETIGEFQEYKYRTTAHQEAARLAKKGE